MSELQQKSIEEILEEIRKKTAPKKQAKGERFKGGTVRDYLRLALAAREHEVFVCLWLDAQHRVISCDEVFRGTLSS